MIFTYLSLFQDKRIFLKTTLTLKIVVFMLCISIAIQTSAELLFHDDFEKDKIGSEPNKWEVGHDGKTTAKVVADPKKASNKVLLTADNPSNDSRHDVGGSIYVVGDAGWDDYVAEWDMMFPDDFYMGVVFRFQDGEKFYLSDRRQGGREYHFYKRQGGWAQVQAGLVENDPEVWYRAQLILDGDKFTFKLKERKDNRSFDKIDPATEGQDGTFKTGKFGNYGLVYIDNIFIGDSVEDLVLPVEPQDKLSITWGAIKDAY
ncbi:hypothetical protein F4054_10330 [Candidatus Poribacteria bacterium]|nr:hypothetical protein [Candidatus Poribacteria bacterium]MYG08526.1 hypothetical protein [Candidatus Poribacteria bacterium]MYK22643.1 hypothetical protein [Candidatus Poribacteria bacterium]